MVDKSSDINIKTGDSNNDLTDQKTSESNSDLTDQKTIGLADPSDIDIKINESNNNLSDIDTCGLKHNSAIADQKTTDAIGLDEDTLIITDARSTDLDEFSDTRHINISAPKLSSREIYVSDLKVFGGILEIYYDQCKQHGEDPETQYMTDYKADHPLRELITTLLKKQMPEDDLWKYSKSIMYDFKTSNRNSSFSAVNLCAIGCMQHNLYDMFCMIHKIFKLNNPKILLAQAYCIGTEKFVDYLSQMKVRERIVVVTSHKKPKTVNYDVKIINCVLKEYETPVMMYLCSTNNTSMIKCFMKNYPESPIIMYIIKYDLVDMLVYMEENKISNRLENTLSIRDFYDRCVKYNADRCALFYLKKIYDTTDNDPIKCLAYAKCFVTMAWVINKMDDVNKIKYLKRQKENLAEAPIELIKLYFQYVESPTVEFLIEIAATNPKCTDYALSSIKEQIATFNESQLSDFNEMVKKDFERYIFNESIANKIVTELKIDIMLMKIPCNLTTDDIDPYFIYNINQSEDQAIKWLVKYMTMVDTRSYFKKCLELKYYKAASVISKYVAGKVELPEFIPNLVENITEENVDTFCDLLKTINWKYQKPKNDICAPAKISRECYEYEYEAFKCGDIMDEVD